MAIVDRVGRRFMMILGCAGIGISHLFSGLAYRAGWHGAPILILTLCAIACYAMTLAPVTWVLIAEIFPNRIRSLGVSLAVSGLWIASFLLTYTFPLLNRALGSSGIFFAYGAICLLGGIFVLTSVTETKGQSLEEIEQGVMDRALRRGAR
jgi:MFS family permease